MAQAPLSWRDQLLGLRNKVVEAEKRRDEDKRLRRERSKEAIQERLKEETPEALNARLSEMRKRFGRAARQFFPLPHLEAFISEVGDFGSNLRFYKECQKEFGDVFSSHFRQTLDRLLRSVGELQRNLDKQLGQWRKVNEIVKKTAFREKTPDDDAGLVEIATTFHAQAHGLPLSLPRDFFAKEKKDFYVADYEGQVYGYVKYWPKENVTTFAITPPLKINLGKLVRGFLCHFYKNAAHGRRFEEARVRLSYAREVRFFTDMGFIRGETHGMSDWTYHRELG